MKKLKVITVLTLVMLTSIVMVACKNGEDKIMNQAKQTYLETVLKPENPEATIGDVTFTPFLGVYNGSLVAVFYGGKYHGNFPENVISLEIEGLDFSYPNGYPILVWNDNNIIELAEAYEQGLLTKANLETVHSLYRS